MFLNLYSEVFPQKHTESEDLDAFTDILVDDKEVELDSISLDTKEPQLTVHKSSMEKNDKILYRKFHHKKVKVQNYKSIALLESMGIKRIKRPRHYHLEDSQLARICYLERNREYDNYPNNIISLFVKAHLCTDHPDINLMNQVAPRIMSVINRKGDNHLNRMRQKFKISTQKRLQKKAILPGCPLLEEECLVSFDQKYIDSIRRTLKHPMTMTLEDFDKNRFQVDCFQ